MPLAVGLDVGSHAVRAAVVRTGFGPPEVVALEERPLEHAPDGTLPPDEVAAAIRDLLAKLPDGVEAVHTSLPGDTVSARLVDIPAAAAKKADQVLGFELEALLPFDLATAVFHFQPAPGSPTDKARFLVAASPETRVEEHLERCRAAGADPRSLSAGALPLADLVPPAPRTRGGGAAAEAVVLVIDVGHRRTDLVGVVSGRPVFVRTISQGGAAVTTAIAAALHFPPAEAEAVKHGEATLRADGATTDGGAAPTRFSEAVRVSVEPLLRDLRQSVAALTASTGAPPVTIALAGGGSRLAGLPELIEDALRIPVTAIAPPHLKTPIDAEKLVVFAKALGLALRSAHKAQRIDLRRDRFAVQADARAVRGRWIASVVLVGLVVVAWGFSAAVRYSVLQQEADRHRTSLKTITKELLGEEIDDFARAASLAQGNADLRDPMPQMDALAALDSLSTRIPESIQHDIDEIEIGPERLEMRGLVDTLADVDNVYAAVAEEPCFPVVNRGKTTRNVSDGRQKYQIDVEIRCETAADAGPGENAAGKRTSTSSSRPGSGL